MLFTPEPPELEPDACTMPISAQPTPGEYGVHTFGRRITRHLTDILNRRVDPPVYRENRWDQRPVPHASTFELTIVTPATHTVLITMYEVKPPLSPGPVTAYAISLDGRRVPFEPGSLRDVDWQLARTIGIAVSDHDLPAERAAADARDDQPSTGNGAA